MREVAELSTKHPLDRGQTAQAIYAQLRADILGGVIAPGERLGEVGLAERFDVSRGPIRAALGKLAEQGIVIIVPNSGARVRIMNRADAAALYQIRTALEAESASLAAKATDRACLNGLLTEHADKIALHPAGAYLQPDVDRDFHLVVAQLSGNPIILRLLSHEFYPQMTLLRLHHTHISGRGAVALREHVRIAEAIVEGDAEVAALLMRRHIANSWAALEAQLVDGGDA